MNLTKSKYMVKMRKESWYGEQFKKENIRHEKNSARIILELDTSLNVYFIENVQEMGGTCAFYLNINIKHKFRKHKIYTKYTFSIYDVYKQLRVMKLSDAQESLQRLERCIYREDNAFLSEEDEEWGRRAREGWNERY